MVPGFSFVLLRVVRSLIDGLLLVCVCVEQEPAVSEAERKAMMAHYFKRQEQMKKLAENDEDDFMHSTWADPKKLKRDLMGAGSLNFGVGRR